MQATKPFIFRFGAGLVALAAVALVVFAIGNSSDAPSASAAFPTPEKIANDGNLGGVSDINVGGVSAGTSVFYCITKTDHEVVGTTSDPDIVQTHSQCNIKGGAGPLIEFINGEPGDPPLAPPSWSDLMDEPSLAWPNEVNPDDNAGDFIPELGLGPPGPPPHTPLEPGRGSGFFYETGAVSPAECAGDPCIVTWTCFEDVGSPYGTGPNIVSRAVLIDPKNPVTQTIVNAGSKFNGRTVDLVTEGTVTVYYNQDSDACKSVSAGTPLPKGDPVFSGGLQSVDVYDKDKLNPNPNPMPYRTDRVADGPFPCGNGLTCTPTIFDFDGDGCNDEDELSLNKAKGCGDDPQNPSDSFDSNDPDLDLSGIYSIAVRVLRGDCENPCTDVDGEVIPANLLPGIYFHCRADLQEAANVITLTPFCYADTTASEINPQGFPGVTGDGFAGSPPPGPCAAPDPLCQAAFPKYAFGNTSLSPTTLTGAFLKPTNELTLTGCFVDVDKAASLGNVYVEATVPAHQQPGIVEIWTEFVGGNPTGHVTVIEDGGGNNIDCAPNSLTPTLVGEATTVKPNPTKGKDYDQDQDGVSTATEVSTHAACGFRDPYNPYDYYDVSIPRDGVINLFVDILGVINNFNPSAYVPLTPAHSGPGTLENYDRPGPITGGAGSWNRGAPDGNINLFNDILGVIGQFNSAGCP